MTIGPRSVPYDPTRRSLYRPGDADDFFLQSKTWTEVALCAELSRLSYCSDAERRQRSLTRAGLREREFLDVKGTQVLIAVGERQCFVAFRGTDGLAAMLKDLSVVPVPWEAGGRVHGGFARYLGNMRGPLTAAIGGLAGRDVVFTGHSLGAAAAVLAGSLWPQGRVYAFGLPRVGDAAFAATLGEGRVVRFVDCCDRVCRVPPEALGYVDVGILHYIDRNGTIVISPTAAQVTSDRRAGSHAYYRDHAWVLWRNVLTRDLADHAPINYVAPL